MAISKTNQYPQEILEAARKYRALGHAARQTVATLLLHGEVLTNKDLTTALALRESTVHHHLRKMSEANLIAVDFNNGTGEIRPTPELAKYFPLAG